LEHPDVGEKSLVNLGQGIPELEPVHLESKKMGCCKAIGGSTQYNVD